MALTLGTTGMDSATEAELHQAFQVANAQAGGHWSLVGENEADYVVVDMDSMYGPMSWLRLHAAGKQVIGLTSAARTQTDFRLARPLDRNAFAELLLGIAQGQGLDAAAPEPSAAADRPVATAQPSGMSPAPVPQDQLPEEHPQAHDEEAEAATPLPSPPGSIEAGSLAPTTIEPPAAVAPATPPPPPQAPPMPLAPRGLGDWLAPGALPGRMRFRRHVGPALLIDPATRTYHGPATLKPIAEYFEGSVGLDDFEPVDAATWAHDAAALGAAQPLSRLQWFAGLVAGKGQLLPGYEPEGRFRLGKWPQTEREYPKHFRIATAMMKGPTTIDELAAASGVERAEVVDFVNANLATGFAEPWREPEPEPEAPRPGGLLGRLRGK
jgi:hypothetical protein